MNVDFGKPFNGVLARINIGFTIFFLGMVFGYVVYLGFEYDRSLIWWVGMIMLLVLVAISIFYAIRKLWLYPKFRITPDNFLARDSGPVWKLRKYSLLSISDVRGYGLPYVGFKYRGRKVFLYLPLMGRKERIRLVSELGLAANKSLNPDASDANTG